MHQSAGMLSCTSTYTDHARAQDTKLGGRVPELGTYAATNSPGIGKYLSDIRPLVEEWDAARKLPLTETEKEACILGCSDALTFTDQSNGGEIVAHYDNKPPLAGNGNA